MGFVQKGREWAEEKDFELGPRVRTILVDLARMPAPLEARGTERDKKTGLPLNFK
jgi:hypothetical protein